MNRYPAFTYPFILELLGQLETTNVKVQLMYHLKDGLLYIL
jgi:hypothetical protein